MTKPASIAERAVRSRAIISKLIDAEYHARLADETYLADRIHEILKLAASVNELATRLTQSRAAGHPMPSALEIRQTAREIWQRR